MNDTLNVPLRPQCQRETSIDVARQVFTDKEDSRGYSPAVTQYLALPPQRALQGLVTLFILERSDLFFSSLFISGSSEDKSIASSNRHLACWECSIWILLREDCGEHPGHSFDCARHLQDRGVD